jgi:membrane protease YdiL (CAAX protease family)
MNAGPTNDRERRWLFVVEIAVVAGIFYLAWRHLLPVSKVPYLFVLGWISLRLRGQRWKDVGFTIAPNWPMLLFVGVLVGLGMEALELFVTQPALTKLLGKGPDLSPLNSLIGNGKKLVVALVLFWVLAAFGEELVYRGYLMNRVAGVLGGSNGAWIVSFIFMIVLFGLHHFSQGVTGISENMVDGAILGALYLATGRNLLAPIIAHGIQDTVDAPLIYSGHYPGMV